MILIYTNMYTVNTNNYVIVINDTYLYQHVYL